MGGCDLARHGRDHNVRRGFVLDGSVHGAEISGPKRFPAKENWLLARTFPRDIVNLPTVLVEGKLQKMGWEKSAPHRVGPR